MLFKHCQDDTILTRIETRTNDGNCDHGFFSRSASSLISKPHNYYKYKLLLNYLFSLDYASLRLGGQDNTNANYAFKRFQSWC